VTILSIDPSLSSTGWAVIIAGRVESCGLLNLTEDADLPERLIELARDVREIVGGQVEPYPDVVVVERPENKRRGGGSWANISPFDLTKYGAAFGAVVVAAREMMPKTALLLTPTPSEWVGRGIIPSSRGDGRKIQRVKYVESRCPEVRGMFTGAHGRGYRGGAGDMADAILIGFWAREAAPLAMARKATA
jgi:hypothetical protein